MNEYFEWRLMIEQTQFMVVGLVILLGASIFLILTGYEIFRDYRRKHWRLLIRTSRYAGVYEGWIPYAGEPGYEVLLKWRSTDSNLTGGEWVYYKDFSQSTWIDRLRASRSP